MIEPRPNSEPASRRRVVVLGSTGSIGLSTLDVLERLPDRFQIVGLVAGTRHKELFDQARRFRPSWIALSTGPGAPGDCPPGIELLTEADEVARRVQAADVDIVVSAVVGAAGLRLTWAALEAGKTVALANKETLVIAGRLAMELAAARGREYCPLTASTARSFNSLPIERAMSSVSY